MIFTQTPISGAVIIDLEPIRDERGSFARAWDRQAFLDNGIDGFHWNPAPDAEAKTVRCVSGSVVDVIVDMRPDSSTLHHWLGVDLTAANQRMLHIPEGVANGFLITSADTTLIYTTNRCHRPGVERGFRFDDPVIGVTWPTPVTIVSDKDRSWPPLGAS